MSESIISPKVSERSDRLQKLAELQKHNLNPYPAKAQRDYLFS